MTQIIFVSNEKYNVLIFSTFSEPVISLVVNPNSISVSSSPALVNISCHAKVTDGKPKYRIMMDHDPIMSIIQTPYFERDMGYYYKSTWSEIIYVHGTGLVTCKVEDKRGTYTAEQNITLLPIEASNPPRPSTTEPSG